MAFAALLGAAVNHHRDADGKQNADSETGGHIYVDDSTLDIEDCSLWEGGAYEFDPGTLASQRS